jgi:hypothetical protein
VLTNYSATGAPYYSSLGAEYVEPVDELIDMAQQLSRRVNKNLAEMHLPRQVGALIDSLQGNPDPERMQSLMNDTTNAQAVKAAVDSGANSGGSSNGGGFSALALFSSSGADEAEDDLPMMAVMDDDDDEEEGDELMMMADADPPAMAEPDVAGSAAGSNGSASQSQFWL